MLPYAVYTFHAPPNFRRILRLFYTTKSLYLLRSQSNLLSIFTKGLQPIVEVWKILGIYVVELFCIYLIIAMHEDMSHSYYLLPWYVGMRTGEFVCQLIRSLPNNFYILNYSIKSIELFTKSFSYLPAINSFTRLIDSIMC